ncbi:hypothetical protein D3C80_1460130 [compost metagenome]
MRNKVGIEGVQALSHIRDNLNRVGILNLDDVDRQRRLAIIEGTVFWVGSPLGECGDVAKINGCATASCDDHVQQRLRFGDAALDLDRAFGNGIDKASSRAVAVAGT